MRPRCRGRFSGTDAVTLRRSWVLDAAYSVRIRIPLLAPGTASRDPAFRESRPTRGATGKRFAAAGLVASLRGGGRRTRFLRLLRRVMMADRASCHRTDRAMMAGDMPCHPAHRGALQASGCLRGKGNSRQRGANHCNREKLHSKYSLRKRVARAGPSCVKAPSRYTRNICGARDTHAGRLHSNGSALHLVPTHPAYRGQSCSASLPAECATSDGSPAVASPAAATTSCTKRSFSMTAGASTNG